MEPTQNPTPQEPKKSFWQKLFGGGKSVTPPASSSTPTSEPVSANSQSDADPVSDSSSEDTVPPVVSDSTWNNEPVAPAEEQSTWNSEPVPSPTETVVPPVPSWRNTPSATAEPLTEVPVPPGDPMVTPVQPAEPVNSDETPAPNNNITIIQEQKETDRNSQPEDERPTITPPSR